MDATSEPALLLPFEEDDLTLMPMAARRALDRTGLKLSLGAWQGLSLLARHAIVALGASAEVEPERVKELLEAARPMPEPIEAAPEPPADAPPPVVSGALGDARPIDPATWTGLSPLARFALDNYARRGRAEKLAAAYDSLVLGSSEGTDDAASSGRSQS